MVIHLRASGWFRDPEGGTYGQTFGPASSAEALRDEYSAIVNAGFVLQLDDPGMADSWNTVMLAEGKRLLPGVVSHSTNLTEHPDLGAQRLMRFAQRVGRDNVIASTECGLGGRVAAQIAWAKLESLVKGAALASEKLGAPRAALAV